jgi:hypothetical protein
LTAAATYDRELEWNELPTSSERSYTRWTVVRAAGAPAAAWWPLARIGRVALHLAPPGTEMDAPVLSATPAVAAKRGRRGSGDYAGVDGHVGLADRHLEENDGVCANDSPAPPHAPQCPPAGAGAGRIRVAVVDVSFDNLEALGAAVFDGPMLVGLPGERDTPTSVVAPGHGTMMAGVVLADAPDAHVGLFQIAGVAGAARPYLATADLAAAVAAAVEGWRADVVLIAMSDGAWGTPSYLSDVLREAARCGRGGRGAAIFCSVGDPSRNHVRQIDSAALGADDLASQPWVQAIAACDQRGRWYRTYARYGDGLGATYNRLGPAVALAASGEPRRWSERIAADDSSQASALAAAAAARVLAANPDLSVVELRALLALTADVPSDVDDGRGLAAGAFDGRDRMGHSFKLGHGVVNPRAASLAAVDPICLALLATRTVPDPDPAPAGEGGGRALALARAWRAALLRETHGPAAALARAYAQIAPPVSRLFLTSLPVQQALGWLARHVRALCDAADLATWRAQDHGALVQQIRYALEIVGESLPSGEGPAMAALQDLQEAIAAVNTSPAVGTFLAIAFAPAVIAGDGGKGEPGAGVAASNAEDDHRHRAGAGRRDRDGGVERAPFVRPRVPGPVHRSAR